MDPEDIQSAFVSRCQSVIEARGLTVVLPGFGYDKIPVPGITLQVNPTGRRNPTLEGGAPKFENGVFTAVVVVQDGRGTAVANGHAAAIAALFEHQTRFAAATHTIRVKSCDIRSGYPTNTDWRVPVVVRYEIEI